MSSIEPFGMSELEAVGTEPRTTLKVEVTTSAKGEVNVSWSVRLEVPTWDEGDVRAHDAVVGRLDQLLATTALQAAGAKYTYIDHLATSAQNADPRSGEVPIRVRADSPFVNEKGKLDGKLIDGWLDGTTKG